MTRKDYEMQGVTFTVVPQTYGTRVSVRSNGKFIGEFKVDPVLIQQEVTPEIEAALENRMETKHTPTPWIARNDIIITVGRTNTIEYNDSDGNRTIVAEMWPCDDNYRGSAISEPIALANTDLVLRAVNNHQALVDALRRVTQELADLHDAIRDQGLGERFIDDSTDMLTDGQVRIEQARAALAAAEGK